MTLRAPTPITLEHAQAGALDAFDSGEPNPRLAQAEALRNHVSGASRTFVV